MDKVRLNAYVTKDIKEYIDQQCNYFGISQGAFISVVMRQYKQQNEALDAIKRMTSDEIISKLKGSTV